MGHKVGHNPRCAIFNEPPTLRNLDDCNCGTLPPLPTTGRIMTDEQLQELVERIEHVGNQIADATRNFQETSGEIADSAEKLLAASRAMNEAAGTMSYSVQRMKR